MPPSIRPYQPTDRDAVRRIYADTAFFGEPVEAYFDDRGLFADLGIDAYLDHYSQYAWVAGGAETVVGYIVGCPLGDTEIRRHNLARLPRVLLRLAAGRYCVGRKTLAYVYDQALAAIRRELIEIHSALYPANLHINLLPAYRGRGLGSALLEAHLAQLSAEAVPGVHAVTTDRNVAAVRLYQKFGFALIAEATTSAWKRHVRGRIRLLAFGLRLPTGTPAREIATSP